MFWVQWTPSTLLFYISLKSGLWNHNQRNPNANERDYTVRRPIGELISDILGLVYSNTPPKYVWSNPLSITSLITILCALIVWQTMLWSWCFVPSDRIWEQSVALSIVSYKQYLHAPTPTCSLVSSTPTCNPPTMYPPPPPTLYRAYMLPFYMLPAPIH